MDITEMKLQLQSNIRDVVQHLLPNGTEESGQWCIGDIAGNIGKSTKISLQQGKAGLFIDHATGIKGDVITLWEMVKGYDRKSTFDDIRSYLGGTRKNYVVSRKRPIKPTDVCYPGWVAKPQTPVLKYFAERGLADYLMSDFRIMSSTQQDVIFFPYLDEDGKLLMYKCRKLDEKRYHANKDAEHHAFGWHLTREAKDLIITEGEFDAMCFYSQGLASVSVPFGGGGKDKQKWIDNDYERLERFENIYIATDMDEAGEEAAETIIARLGADRCYRVLMPFKDVNECLLNGMDLKRLIQDAEPCRKSLIKSSNYFHDTIIKSLREGNVITGVTLPWQKTHDYIRLRPAETSLWTGINGHGKTEVMGHIVVYLVASGHKCVVASLEMKPRRLLERLITQASTIPFYSLTEEYTSYVINDFFGKNLALFDVTGNAKLDIILENFIYARKRFGYEFFFIDSLSKCGIDEDDYNGQKRAIDALTDFARDYDCHVNLVVHPRKVESEERSPGKMDVRGGMSLTDMADNLFSIWRNKPGQQKRDIAEKTNKPASKDVLECFDVKIDFVKDRENGNERPFFFWYDKSSRQLIESYGGRPRLYAEWEQ